MDRQDYHNQPRLLGPEIHNQSVKCYSATFSAKIVGKPNRKIACSGLPGVNID